MKETVEISLNFDRFIPTTFKTIDGAIAFIRAKPLKEVVNTRIRQGDLTWDNF